MDTELLVDRRIDDGMKLITLLVRDSFDVTAAFWVKTREECLWFLYIASNSVDLKKSLGDGYRRLYASLSKISDTSISLAEVKLIDDANPIANAALKLRDNPVSGGVPILYRTQFLGGLSVEEVYIYPRLGPMTPNEIMHKVLGLMSRRGGMQPSQITLHDGSAVFAVPCGIKTVGNAVQVELLEAGGASRFITVDQIASIQ